MPSLSRSRCGAYPGSPRRTGAAPAARASSQFLNAPDFREGVAGESVDGTADRAGLADEPRWQWYSPVLRSVWQPFLSRPPLCANAAMGNAATSTTARNLHIAITRTGRRECTRAMAGNRDPYAMFPFPWTSDAQREVCGLSASGYRGLNLRHSGLRVESEYAQLLAASAGRRKTGSPRDRFIP